MKTVRAYLDCNATHPLLPQARAAVVAALDVVGNPSSVHAEGRAARSLVNAARRSVAALVNARPEHVVFTSGATEAANLVLTPDWTLGRAPLRFERLLVSATEHPVILTGGRFTAQSVEILPVTSSGELRLDALAEALRNSEPGKALVSVQHANNETGVIQPIPAIAALVKAHGGVLVVDAVQSFGRIPIDITDGCGDFLIVSSHKIGGPKGAGALIGVTDLMMPAPLMRGGGQEKGHRGGTEALPLLAGFGAAAEAAMARISRGAELAKWRGKAEAIIKALVPDAVFHGLGAAQRLPNTLFFTIPGLRAETAQIAFDLEGVALSAGSACSSGKVGPSHVLKAMGIGHGDGALRLSLSLETTDGDLALFEQALAAIAGRRKTI